MEHGKGSTRPGQDVDNDKRIDIEVSRCRNPSGCLLVAKDWRVSHSVAQCVVMTLNLWFISTKKLGGGRHSLVYQLRPSLPANLASTAYLLQFRSVFSYYFFMGERPGEKVMETSFPKRSSLHFHSFLSHFSRAFRRALDTGEWETCWTTARFLPLRTIRQVSPRPLLMGILGPITHGHITGANARVTVGTSIFT